MHHIGADMIFENIIFAKSQKINPPFCLQQTFRLLAQPSTVFWKRKTKNSFVMCVDVIDNDCCRATTPDATPETEVMHSDATNPKKRKEPEAVLGTAHKDKNFKTRRVILQSWGQRQFRVFEKPLGAGAYGIVCKVQLEGGPVGQESSKQHEEEMALKLIKDEATTELQKDEARHEWEIVDSIRRRFDGDLARINIINIYDTGVCEQGNFLSVMEKMDAPLSHITRRNGKYRLRRLSPLAEAKILARLLVAMRACHLTGLAHFDIKPDNVMLRRGKGGKKGGKEGGNGTGGAHAEDLALDGEEDVRLIDFSLSRSPESVMQLGRDREHRLQTRWYRAPENCNAKKWPTSGFAADIWSVGCIMYELLCPQGNWAFPAQFDETQLPLIERYLRTNKLQNDLLRARVPLAAVDLMSWMLVQDPEKRITFDEIRQHRYFTAFPETAAIFEPVVSRDTCVNTPQTISQ